MILSIILGLIIAVISGLIIPLLLSPFIIAWHLLIGIVDLAAEALMYILIGLIKLIFKAIKAIFRMIF